MEFRTTVLLGGKTATGLRVPPEIVEALGSSKRPKVTITINGYQYRTTLAVMGGEFLVPLAADHREAAGVSAGDEVDVTISLDTAPREVEVPDDLEAALAADLVAKEAFERLSYSHKRQHVLAIEGAKQADTRARRVARAVAMLREG